MEVEKINTKKDGIENSSQSFFNLEKILINQATPNKIIILLLITVVYLDSNHA